MNIKFKRLGAYLIDIFIVSMLVVLIGNIKSLNPNLDKYQNTLDEYTEYYNANFGNVTTVEPGDLLNDEYAKYMRDLNYYSLSNSIIEIIVIILYFTLFPRFNNDQTIGKRLFKIKVVNFEEKYPVKLWKHFIRSLIMPICANVILYNVITTIINICGLFIFKGVTYLYANLIVTYIINLYCYADVVISLTRKDNRSLHDLICNTKVIEIC